MAGHCMVIREGQGDFLGQIGAMKARLQAWLPWLSLVPLVPGSSISSISWLAPRVKDPGAVEVEEKGGESEVPQLSISQHDYPVVSLSSAQYKGRLLLNAIDMVLICTGKVCNL